MVRAKPTIYVVNVKWQAPISRKKARRAKVSRDIDKRANEVVHEMRNATMEDRRPIKENSDKHAPQRRSVKSTQSKDVGSRVRSGRDTASRESRRSPSQASSYYDDRESKDRPAPEQRSSRSNDRRAPRPASTRNYDRRAADEASSQYNNRTVPDQTPRYNDYHQSSREPSHSRNHSRDHSRGRERKPVTNPMRFDSGFAGHELSEMEDSNSLADSGYPGGYFDNDSRNNYRNDSRKD